METPATQPARSAAASKSIDRLINEAAQLARGHRPAREFYRELLALTANALGARAAAVWGVERKEPRQILASYFAGRPEEDFVPSCQAATMLNQVVATAAPAMLGVSGHVREETLHTVFVPVIALDTVVAVIELQGVPSEDPVQRAEQEELLLALGELAGDRHCRRQLVEARERLKDWEQLERFVGDVYGRLDLDETCYTIVNDGRQLIGWDRLTLLLRRGSRFRVRAISGLDRFDRRAEPVVELERLAGATARTGESLWAAGGNQELPEQLAAPLELYLDRSASRSLVVLLLPGTSNGHRSPAGILVLERFTQQEPTDAERFWIGLMARHSGLAIEQVGYAAGIPRIMRWGGRVLGPSVSSRLPLMATLLVVVMTALAALAAVPTRFEIECRGSLQPTVQSEVFAPRDGTVERVVVDSGQRVGKGDLLVELRNSELEFEMTRVLGQWNTVQTQLLAIQASMSGAIRDTERRLRSNEFAVEEERLKEEAARLDRQRSVLERQRDEMQVTSPIDGEILSWDLAQRLAGRPVRRGQRLLSIADPEGPWHLELALADHDLGHVLHARAAGPEALPVRFVLSSQPGRVHAAQLEEIGLSSEIVDGAGPVVTARARVAADPQLDIRAGAEVVARVDCGRSALVYVWLRDLWEVIRLKTFW